MGSAGVTRKRGGYGSPPSRGRQRRGLAQLTISWEKVRKLDQSPICAYPILTPILRAQPSAAPRRLDRGDVDFLHSHHRIESALCFIAASSKRVSQHARRDLPGNSPLVFAPPARALLPAVTDNCVPVAVRLVLTLGRDLEREGFIVLEYRTTIETKTGYAEDREFHRQHVALFSAGIVAGRMVHGTDSAVGKGRSIEAGSSLSVGVVPQANCVLGHCLAFRFGNIHVPTKCSRPRSATIGGRDRSH